MQPPLTSVCGRAGGTSRRRASSATCTTAATSSTAGLTPSTRGTWASPTATASRTAPSSGPIATHGTTAPATSHSADSAGSSERPTSASEVENCGRSSRVSSTPLNFRSVLRLRVRHEVQLDAQLRQPSALVPRLQGHLPLLRARPGGLAAAALQPPGHVRPRQRHRVPLRHAQVSNDPSTY